MVANQTMHILKKSLWGTSKDLMLSYELETVQIPYISLYSVKAKASSRVGLGIEGLTVHHFVSMSREIMPDFNSPGWKCAPLPLCELPLSLSSIKITTSPYWLYIFFCFVPV